MNNPIISQQNPTIIHNVNVNVYQKLDRASLMNLSYTPFIEEPIKPPMEDSLPPLPKEPPEPVFEKAMLQKFNQTKLEIEQTLKEPGQIIEEPCESSYKGKYYKKEDKRSKRTPSSSYDSGKSNKKHDRKKRSRSRSRNKYKPKYDNYKKRKNRSKSNSPKGIFLNDKFS